MHRAELHIGDDHPAFAGHFPGRPMLPGVVLLAEVLEVVCGDPRLARLVGATPHIATAKFLSPVGPGSHLVLEVAVAGRRLRFEVRHGDRLVACGAFEADAAFERADLAR